MRVISGEFKGRPLKAPKGSDTRPTTDRVKESLMSSLTSIMGGFEGLYVLDAFAGSGGLGIEALSRGAAYCQFFDRNRLAAAAIQANLEMLNIPRSKATVRQSDVFKTPVGAAKPFDLVFLDPPYAIDGDIVVSFVVSLAASGRLSSNAVVVYEHDSSHDLEAVLQKHANADFELTIVKSKRQGACTIDIIEAHASVTEG